jgi:hypothetical protein
LRCLVLLAAPSVFLALGCGAKTFASPMDAGLSCGPLLPAADAEPFGKTCASTSDCAYGVVSLCCGAYAVGFSVGQEKAFEAWAASRQKCLAAACATVDCSGDFARFDNGDTLQAPGGDAAVGVTCEPSWGHAPACTTFLRSIPAADPTASACPVVPEDFSGVVAGLVCFGADPAPYNMYLQSPEAGVVVGRCPSASDFSPVPERCVYSACGPLLPSAVVGLAAYRALDGGGAGDVSCCFWVRRTCLV